MAACKEQSKKVDKVTILLINGFIHEIQKLLKDWIVPSEIIDACIAFYYVELLWDLSGVKQKDSKIIINPVADGSWKTAPLNQSITMKMCDIFEIEMKMIETTKSSRSDLFLGFFKNDLSDLVRDYQVTKKPNTEYIYIYGTRVSTNHKLVHTLSRNFGIHDSVKMVFHFKENECKWFVNFQNEPILTKPIDADAVIPAFSFVYTNVKFEMSDFAFK